MLYPYAYCYVLVCFLSVCYCYSALDFLPESGSLYFQPAFASMLGGNAVSVVGHCFDTEAQSLKGRFETEDGTTEELCCFKENTAAKCYLPLSFHTGMVNVSLNVDNRGWNYSGQLEISKFLQNYIVIVLFYIYIILCMVFYQLIVDQTFSFFM